MERIYRKCYFGSLFRRLLSIMESCTGSGAMMKHSIVVAGASIKEYHFKVERKQREAVQEAS